jgi:hypothetical protein
LAFQSQNRNKRSFYSIRNAYPDSPEKEHRFIQDAEPHPETAVARIADGLGLDGNRGLELAFAADEQTPRHRKERMELYLAHGSDPDSALHLGEVSYLGYALYVDPEMPPLTEHATITQCWQLPSSVESFETGAFRQVKTVPMWMVLKTINGKPGYSLHVKNEGKPVGTGYRARSMIAGSGPFQPGWNTLIYRFEPRHLNDSRSGRITFWLNTLEEDKPTHDLEYNWGVTPQSELPEGLPDTGYIDRFDVRMGMYRPKQAQPLRLVYDNIRYGQSFGDVLPVNR